ncbi:hypothetical protein PoB_006794500 [Plakobranchus ocellatus]|uniref:Uncharacterized protein n=1 Tax=Plakobranchus ocellatus TaxID=259542 RepID=A0AAV4DBG5_9GAST|nr:hypothetical protein PoB_006794500 [Plakobranchus ocellatus]
MEKAVTKICGSEQRLRGRVTEQEGWGGTGLQQWRQKLQPIRRWIRLNPLDQLRYSPLEDYSDVYDDLQFKSSRDSMKR